MFADESVAEILVDEESQGLAESIGGLIMEAVEQDLVKIPPFPAVAMQVQEVLREEHFGLNDLARVVERDQALVAAVLKTANSSFYGSKRKVTSLHTAIGRIGATQLQRVLVAASLGTTASRAGPLLPLRTAVWRDSLLSAHLCQTLARSRGVDGEEAFICGMLHDFGAALALGCAEDFLSAWPDPAPMPPEFWAAIIDQHHVALGVRLVRSWGLDDTLMDSIQQHHESVDSPSPLVELVRASDSVIGFLAAEQAPVSEDFARLPFVGGLREGKLIAATIGDILAAVASFDVDQKGRRQGHVVLVPETTLKGPARPATFAVKVLGADDERDYQAQTMTSTGLAFIGSGVLATNSLVRARLECAGITATIWGNVVLCVAEKGHWRLEIAPVALSDPDRDAWNHIFVGLGGEVPVMPAPRPAVLARAEPSPAPTTKVAEPDPKPSWWKRW